MALSALLYLICLINIERAATNVVGLLSQGTSVQAEIF